MVKVKLGAVTEEISEGALEWYLMAGWKVVEEPKKQVKEKSNDKTDTKKTTSK